jgi:signal transduction histidine kinase/ActR/RegA family two-component response regulator
VLHPDNAVLILAPRGRDATVIRNVLAQQHGACRICPDFMSLLAQLGPDAALAIVTEEALLDADLRTLSGWLQQQPSWSDFPFVLLATHQAGRRSSAASERLEQLGNVVIIERPFNSETLRKAAASAHRARMRQYQARQKLDELRDSEERLTASEAALQGLNETLETRIAERTSALAQANDRLMREIGERERAQGALLHAQKMEAVGQLTGGIAHDFNNLLAGVAGYVALIQRMSSDERLQQMAANASRACARGARLTGQLLAFSRNQSMQLQPTALADVLTGMQELLRMSVGSRIVIEMDLNIAGLQAIADASQLELAVLNLAINARDAMPDGGTLRIIADRHSGAPDEALAAGEYLRVAVQDSGGGIPHELLPKVFDPFFTTKPIGKGTGLGLSQVYGIARQFGGTAQIHSREGKGTTVEIWLPIAPQQHVEAAKLENLPLVTTRGGRIMVVEDDAQVRDFLVDCLQIHGYHVTSAHDGPQALEKLAYARPDLLIMDFIMPGMNGAETVLEMRRYRPGLPVIFATGYADMQVIERVEGQIVLRKPFEISELLRSIELVLRGRSVDAAMPGADAMH